MKYPMLNDSERAVLDMIAQRGTASLQDILPALIPELGLYYAAEVLQSLYAMNLIREVDTGLYSLGVPAEATNGMSVPVQD